MFVKEQDQHKHVTQHNAAGFSHCKGPRDSGNTVGGQKHPAVSRSAINDSRIHARTVPEVCNTCPGICQAAVGTSSCLERARARGPSWTRWNQSPKRHIKNWWQSSTPPGPVDRPGAACTSRWSAYGAVSLLSRIRISRFSSVAARSRHRSHLLQRTSRLLLQTSTRPQPDPARTQRGRRRQAGARAPPAGSGFVSGADEGLWSTSWCLPAQWGPAEVRAGRPPSEPEDWGHPVGVGHRVNPHTLQNLLSAASEPPAYNSRHLQPPLKLPFHWRHKSFTFA